MRGIMIRIVCSNCKEEINVNMYFYDQRIIREQEFLSDKEYYQATVRGKTICPMCGMEVEKRFTSAIYPSEVIQLALKQEIQN